MEEQTRIKRVTRDAQFLLKTIKRRLDDYDFTEAALEDLVSRLVDVVDYLEDLPETEEDAPPPKVYMVHPGWGASKSDSDNHFVSFGRLCELYDVPANRCWNADTIESGYNPESFVHLYPREDGVYSYWCRCSTVEGPCPRHKESS